jgi:hypothetical protein
VKKFVWNTSALINIKKKGYSPAYSLYKDLSDGWIEGPYLNIFPAISIFELCSVVFACIASIEGAMLVTLDRHFEAVAHKITVIDLNGSLDGAHYRKLFGHT